jgi:hypothetical protein
MNEAHNHLANDKALFTAVHSQIWATEPWDLTLLKGRGWPEREAQELPEKEGADDSVNTRSRVELLCAKREDCGIVALNTINGSLEQICDRLLRAF